MPFTSETAIYGGRKKGAGRPRKSVSDAKRQAAELVRSVLNKNAGELAKHYIRTAKQSDRVICHAIDKLMPDEQNETNAAISINFVQYNNTVQLSAEGVSTAVLASNGEQKASGAGVASAGGQGQNGIKFHDFEDVS